MLLVRSSLATRPFFCPYSLSSVFATSAALAFFKRKTLVASFASALASSALAALPARLGRLNVIVAPSLQTSSHPSLPRWLRSLTLCAEGLASLAAAGAFSFAASSPQPSPSVSPSAVTQRAVTLALTRAGCSSPLAGRPFAPFRPGPPAPFGATAPQAARVVL